MLVEYCHITLAIYHFITDRAQKFACFSHIVPHQLLNVLD